MIFSSQDANTQGRTEISRRFAHLRIRRAHRNLGMAGFLRFATPQRQGRRAAPQAAFNLSSGQVCFPRKNLQRSQVLGWAGTVGDHYRGDPANRDDAHAVPSRSATQLLKSDLRAWSSSGHACKKET